MPPVVGQGLGFHSHHASSQGAALSSVLATGGSGRLLGFLSLLQPPRAEARGELFLDRAQQTRADVLARMDGDDRRALAALYD
jgi:hypothetical protein